MLKTFFLCKLWNFWLDSIFVVSKNEFKFLFRFVTRKLEFNNFCSLDLSIMAIFFNWFDIFDKVLIDNNIATRVGKGTHVGIKKVKKCLKDNINKDLYILKFDIKKYFFNLDHDVLKRIIRSKIKDVYAINILDTIIDSTDYDYINEEIDISYSFGYAYSRSFCPS